MIQLPIRVARLPQQSCHLQFPVSIQPLLRLLPQSFTLLLGLLPPRRSLEQVDGRTGAFRVADEVEAVELCTRFRTSIQSIGFFQLKLQNCRVFYFSHCYTAICLIFITHYRFCKCFVFSDSCIRVDQRRFNFFVIEFSCVFYTWNYALHHVDPREYIGATLR